MLPNEVVFVLYFDINTGGAPYRAELVKVTLDRVLEPIFQKCNIQDVLFETDLAYKIDDYIDDFVRALIKMTANPTEFAATQKYEYDMAIYALGNILQGCMMYPNGRFVIKEIK